MTEDKTKVNKIQRIVVDPTPVLMLMTLWAGRWPERWLLISKLGIMGLSI
jgi:hypothetical protein